MLNTCNVNTAMLDDKIKDSGLKIGFIAEKLGISRQAFDKKRKGFIAFKATEAFALCELLGIPETCATKIFLP